MANKLYEESNIQAIANAIRAKGQTGTMTVSQMPTKISNIQTSISIGVENPETKAFRKEVTYPSTYTSSQIVSYKNTSSGYRNDEPTIVYIYGEDNRNNENLCDNVLRWVYVPSVNNVRDLGGWKCNGGNIKYGMIFRGGQMSNSSKVTTISSDDIASMLAIGIKVDLDFRNSSEGGVMSASPLGNTVEYISSIIGAYRAIVPDYFESAQSLRVAINTIINSILDGDSVYMHCVSGADRTATIVFLIEALLGVSQSDLDKEYELTTFSGENIERTRLYTPWKNLLSLTLNEQSSPESWAINWWLNFDLDGNGTYLTSSQLNTIRSALIDGSPSTIVSRTVAYILTNCTCVQLTTYNTSYVDYSTYKPNFIANGTRLSLKVTQDSGYTLTGAIVSITMGGSDVSSCYSNGVVNIQSVTGNVVVNIVAQREAPTYTDLVPTAINTDGTIFNGVGYINEYYWGSSGLSADSSHMSIGLIPVDRLAQHEIYVYGINFGGHAHTRITFFTSAKARIDAASTLKDGYSNSWVDVSKLADNYFRITLKTGVLATTSYFSLCGGTRNLVPIVTIDEPIF